MRITQITPLVMMSNHSMHNVHKTNITPLRSPAQETNITPLRSAEQKTNITPLRMCLNLNKSVWGINQCVEQYKAHQTTL
jgi:hypothetical protein